ncbi:MAG: hypothetical protein DWI58_11265 [Chloroflexi bacterium]|nr:MAG: hypothetical protein DWI58_11265 [Chloroflexota bacterium]
MAESRQQSLIDGLLDEAENAVVAGDWARVATHARSVLALQPDQPDALALLEAASRAESDRQTDLPREIDALLKKAEIAADADDWDEVDSLTDQVLAIDPENVRALLLVAESEIDIEDFDAARAFIDQVLDSDPTNREALLTGAEVARGAADWVRMRSMAQAVLTRYPADKEATAFLYESKDNEVQRLGKYAPGQTVLIREYKTQDEFQRDAALLRMADWRVASSLSRYPRAGCMRILTLGFWTLVFPPKPVLIVTYERDVKF